MVLLLLIFLGAFFLLGFEVWFGRDLIVEFLEWLVANSWAAWILAGLIALYIALEPIKEMK